MSGLRLEVSPDCWKLESSKQKSTLVNDGADDRVVILVSGVSGEFMRRDFSDFSEKYQIFQ